jgi:hypothetical protein
MHNFQKDLWSAITGSDPREMKIIMGGRQVGKSVMAQMWNQTYEIGEYYTVIDRATVDHAQWYTVKCSSKISAWIKGQPEGMWYEHIDKDWMIYKNTLDIHEKIYTMLQLKYGDDRV